MTHNTSDVIKQLLGLRGTSKRAVPAPALVPPFIHATLGTLFPQFSASEIVSETELALELTKSRALLEQLIRPVVPHTPERESVLSSFEVAMPEFHATLSSDAEAIFQGDPAATSVDEVMIAYPGFFAIAVYRFAHWLLHRHVPIVPRMLTEHAHQMTGIDIHPGATIGKAFVIDHGTGIVIGETTLIEDNVKIYQGVTLGALSVDKSLANKKRHPTIRHDTVIYANATILGGDTVVGAHSIIGGNVWLTSSVPERSRIYHQKQGA